MSKRSVQAKRTAPRLTESTKWDVNALHLEDAYACHLGTWGTSAPCFGTAAEPGGHSRHPPLWLLQTCLCLCSKTWRMLHFRKVFPGVKGYWKTSRATKFHVSYRQNRGIVGTAETSSFTFLPPPCFSYTEKLPGSHILLCSAFSAAKRLWDSTEGLLRLSHSEF